MLPIQTVLALLMLLMAVGCSQKSPPRPGSTDLSATQTEDNRQPKPKPDPIIKPGPTNAPDDGAPLTDATKTVGTVEADGQWKVRIGGQGAQKLFDATAIEEVDGKKTGLQYQCEHKDTQYSCIVLVDAVDASVKYLLHKSDLKKAEPTYKPEAPYASSPSNAFVQINAYATEGKNIDITVDGKTSSVYAGPFAVLNFVGASAGKIYNDLVQSRFDESMRATKLDGNDYEVGNQKYGKNVICTARPLKSNPTTQHYWCTFYLNTAEGSINTINLPKAK